MISRMVIVLLALGLFSSTAFSQISSTAPSSRCGEGVLVLHASASSGTITWYEVPFYGTAITEGVSTDGTSLTTPWLEVTKTYYVDALDGEGCSLNPGNERESVIATISANSIQAIIFYSSNTFCKSVEGEQEVTRTGTAGGVFTVDPSGLTLDPETGSINPGTSNEGTYTVTYTVVPAEGCVENPALTAVTITTAPVQPIVSYAGSPYCTSHDPVTALQTGATGGTYSASPSGLTIHPSSGTITPASSTTGTYTITYFVSGAGGCAPMSASTVISILQLPTASISYNSPFTKNQGAQTVTLTGTGVYTGGVYSSTAGLTIHPSTGTITPGTSTAGIYTVTYTLSAAAPCSMVTTTREVTVYALPSAVIAGDNDVCKNSAPAPVITFTGADGTAPYTFTYKVNDGFDQTVTTTSGNSVTVEQPTVTTGTFEYTLVSVMDAPGSTQDQAGTATITINTPLVALFSYPESPYCSNASDPLPTFLDDGIAGIFSSTAGLVFVSTATGQIDLSASTAGTYTVTNTIAATLGCPVVLATADITITRLPVTAFNYPASPYCATTGTATPTITDAGVFTANDPFVIFIDTPPGTVNIAATPPGTYEITNTIITAGGCAEVHDHASITIESTPAMTISHNYSICNATSTNIVLTSTPEATSYSWTIGTVTGSITGAGSGTSTTIIDQVLYNPSNSASGTVEYVVIPTRGTGDCSVGNTFYVTVTVKPTPQLSSTLSPADICSGATFAYAATSAAAGATFAWTRETVAGISEPGTNGTGDVSETLTNTTSAPIEVTYAYITTAEECSNTAQNVVVTVNPIPDEPTGEAAQSFFTDDPHTVANLSATGTNIQWYAESTGGTALETTTALVTGFHYYASQTITNCESSERLDVTVTINPVKNTSLGTNYPTIQAAINAAEPGNTVVASAGEYTEQLLIQKDLILNGSGSLTCIVKAPATGRASAPGYTGYNEDTPWNTDYLIAAYPALLGNTDPTISVKITGFTFDANGETFDFDRFTGVFFRKVFNSNIAGAGLFDCKIKGFSGSSVTGVRVLDGCKLAVDHNSLEDYFMGIVSYGTDNLTKPVVNATYNTLNPTSGTITDDIEFRNVSAGTIGYNAIDYNGHANTSMKIPIAVIGSQNIIADNNTISHSDVGILVDESNSSACTLSNNNISNITFQGLEIEGGNHTLTGNTISYCGEYGIYLRASSNNDVLSNIISHVSTSGFYGGIGLQFASNTNDITGNTVAFSGNNGISLDGSSGNNILNNVISSCQYASFSGTVAAVNIGDASWAIAFNAGSNNNTATGNDITTSDVAIENWDGTGNIATGNKIYGNFYGIHNNTTTTMDATANWWGDATGPTTTQNDPSTNACGTGSMVSLYVDYSPWYTDPAMTPPATGTCLGSTPESNKIIKSW